MKSGIADFYDLNMPIPEPVLLVRQHARAFKNEMQPIMANVQLMLGDLKSEKPLSKDTAEKLEELDKEISKSGEIMSRFRDKLEQERWKEKNKNRNMLLGAVWMAFSHHIGNTFSGIAMDARTASEDKKLTEKRLQRMRESFRTMNNVIEGLVSITEVRLKHPLSDTIYIPGVNNIDFYPILMTSFDILQDQSLEKTVTSPQEDIQTQI